jgi:hypothetical protein
MPSGSSKIHDGCFAGAPLMELRTACRYAVSRNGDSGMVVFCNIYPLLQRAYDQVIHDVAIQNLSVIFLLDRAGLVGEDGNPSRRF